MKKKILLLAAALMMFMGIVSASSINGDYKGNPIVKVMSSGKQLQSDEVPAMIYDGHTVVPISLLRQLGASVEWNQDNYSVDVKLPQNEPVNASVNLLKVRYELINETSKIEYSIDDNAVSKLTFTLKFNSGPDVDDKYNKVINTGIATGVDRLALIDEKQDGYIYNYRMVNIKDYLDKKISADEFKSKIEIQPKSSVQQTSNQPVQQSQTPVGQTGQQVNNNNPQLIVQNNLYSEFNIYLQNSVNAIGGFVNTTNLYYSQWNSGNPSAPSPQYLEGETRRIMAIANEINAKGNQVYAQINLIDMNKTSELIKEIYALNEFVSKSYESIYGWKVSNFDLSNDKYNANKQVAEQYLNEYRSFSSELLSRTSRINEKLKSEYDNQKSIANNR